MLLFNAICLFSLLFTSSSVGNTRWSPLSFSRGIDVPFWRASRISFGPDLNCFSIILIDKLRLLSKTFTTFTLGTSVDKTAGEDFALGFWQKSSSIFLKFIVKSGGSVDDQTDLSENVLVSKVQAGNENGHGLHQLLNYTNFTEILIVDLCPIQSLHFGFW